MPTVRQIAQVAGVSKSTVSLVLNQKAGVSEQMRQTVLQAQAQIVQREAQPSPHGEQAVKNEVRQSHKPLSIMVLHPPVLYSNAVFREVLQGIQAGAEDCGAQLRLVANEPDVPAQHVARLYLSDPMLRPDGVLMFAAKQHEPLLDRAQEAGIPCVVLGRQIENYKVSGLGRDETQYATMATRHLLELGHRAIAFIGGDSGYDFVHTRLAGYQQALREAEITPAPRWVVLGEGSSATQTILRQASDITAALFVNDQHAAQGLPVIRQMGLQIPRDLSVISFDDTEIARDHEPPLTAISYHRYDEGRWASQALIDQIRNPRLSRTQVIFKAELILRESCAPPR